MYNIKIGRKLLLNFNMFFMLNPIANVAQWTAMSRLKISLERTKINLTYS